jgi:hypothetical protein
MGAFIIHHLQFILKCPDITAVTGTTPASPTVVPAVHGENIVTQGGELCASVVTKYAKNMAKKYGPTAGSAAGANQVAFNTRYQKFLSDFVTVPFLQAALYGAGVHFTSSDRKPQLVLEVAKAYPTLKSFAQFIRAKDLGKHNIDSFIENYKKNGQSTK